jgi:hypothetical protein
MSRDLKTKLEDYVHGKNGYLFRTDFEGISSTTSLDSMPQRILLVQLVETDKKSHTYIIVITIYNLISIKGKTEYCQLPPPANS